MSNDNDCRKAFMIDLLELLEKHGATILVSPEYGTDEVYLGNEVSILGGTKFFIDLDDDFVDEMDALKKARKK